MQLTDTHCHIQFADYPLDPEQAIKDARLVGVDNLLVVGCSLEDSQLAVDFASKHDAIWPAVGIHPHEAAQYVDDPVKLAEFAKLAANKAVVAIGECGLDFFYNHSNRADQIKLLRFQLDLAQKHDLPLIFHVREAFSDFWPIFDEYEGLRGVIHSFSSGSDDLEAILSRGLYVGLNGIMTFTKHTKQLDAARTIPLSKLVLETDAPYLTPSPLRGTICQPKHVRVTAEFLSNLRGETLEELATATTRNAAQLFNLKFEDL